MHSLLSFLSGIKPTRWLAACVLLCAAIAAFSLHFSPPVRSEAGEIPGPKENFAEPVQPLVPIAGLSPAKIELGRKLFHDPRLSHNDEVSCASCHSLSTGGADGHVYSIGIHGSTGSLNAPTVFNCGYNLSQFWDGRANTLEQQVDGPVQNPHEMGSTWPEIVAKLNRSPEYKEAFEEIYSDPIGADQIRDAIATFERSLSTPNSRFDRYLRHEPNAITSQERQGYELFKALGCVSCHQGVNLGGNMYQKVGVMATYFTEHRRVSKADLGRFNVTGDPNDMYMFKVPTLRNIALTAPYFHDGTAATLEDAVRLMGKYQLGRDLSSEDVNLLVAFLRTLTGELEGKPL